MSRNPAPAFGALTTLALLALASVTGAQAPRRPELILDAQSRTEIIDGLAQEVIARYVEADTAKMIADILHAQLKAGAYDTLTSVRAFAEAVTHDLRRLNGDLHLSLRFDPDGLASRGGPVIVRRSVPDTLGAGVPEGGGGPGRRRLVAGGAGETSTPGNAGGPVIVRESRSGPGGPGQANSPWAREAREKNFGLGRAEILAGNVGYLEINGFMESEGMEDALVGALKFLERTDAMIIDLRRNRGGSGNMSHLVFSHFLGEKPVPTIRVKSRDEALNRDMESLAEVPGPRRPDVPLYVLTSRSTGSAAEEFSFVLKNLGRATLVGTRTGGAGHMVGMYPVPHGFAAGISITRVSDPKTGAEWERIGVQPDVNASSEHALAAAHAAALRKIAVTADEPRQRTLEMAAEWVEARDQPVRVQADRLAACEGSYGGDREVWLEKGRLMYRRAGGISEELIPLRDGRFSLAGESRFTFAAGSPSPSFSVERSDGSSATYGRVSGRLQHD